ncbi:MAG: hypothetical protein ABIN67_04615 [Ferruginibacter sp.]
MENLEINNESRQQLSSDLFIPRILICVFLFFLFLLLSDYRRTDLSTSVTYALIFVGLVFLLVSIIRRPIVHFDATALHIKNAKGDERLISFIQLESVEQTLFNYGLSSYFSMYKINYMDRGNLLSFKVIVNSVGNPTAKFQKAVEAVNPNVAF